MPMTGDAGQVGLEAKKSKMPETAKAEATNVSEPELVEEPEIGEDARTEPLSTPEPEPDFKAGEDVVEEEVPEVAEADVSQPSVGVESERYKDEL